MSKEIIIHKQQSSIFDIVEDTTTQMPITVKDQSINLKLSSLVALNYKYSFNRCLLLINSLQFSDAGFAINTIALF